MAKHGGVKDSGEYFVITPASRKVTVPHAHKSISTVGDHNSEQITFKCPQMVDGHDVSKCARRYITWINVQDEIGHDGLELAQVEQGEEGMIYLAWTIRNSLTVDKGVVQFSVHFEDTDENGTTLYRWSTTTCRDCEILDSINAVLGAYEAIYVHGDTLVFSDYNPVQDKSLKLETNGIIPEGTKKIDANGLYYVGEFAQVEVAVDAGTPEITVREDGLITAREGGVEAQVQLSAEHDPEFVPENIRKGVTIFGVEGTNAPTLVSGTIKAGAYAVGMVVYYSGCDRQGAESEFVFDNYEHLLGSQLTTKFVKGSLISISPMAGNQVGFDVEVKGSVTPMRGSVDGSLFVLRPTGDDFEITFVKKE